MFAGVEALPPGIGEHAVSSDAPHDPDVTAQTSTTMTVRLVPLPAGHGVCDRPDRPGRRRACRRTQGEVPGVQNPADT